MVATSQVAGKMVGTSFLPKIWQKLQNYCYKTYQCLTQNPQLFVMRKLGRFELVRDIVCYLHRSSQSVAPVAASTLEHLHVPMVVSSLRREGCHMGLQLPATIVQEILHYAQTQPCYGDRDPNYPFFHRIGTNPEVTTGKSFRCASYLQEPCPAILKIINDPGILAIAAQYLQAKPRYIASELLWSFPVAATWDEKVQMAQVFHYDLDDYRSIKFFFYLTDVDATSGAHVCIRSTHRNKRLVHQLLGQRCAGIADEKLVADYGAENVVVITGQPGYGFVEDSCCFHKGTVPQQQERLLLQIEYAINSYGNIRAF